jgi:Na+-driven multidrug efflux pump
MFSNLTVSLNVLCAEGVAVGCGWQAFVAYVNVGCYYLIGVPLGVLLGFTFDLGAKVIYIIPLLDISGLVFPY